MKINDNCLLTTMTSNHANSEVKDIERFRVSTRRMEDTNCISENSIASQNTKSTSTHFIQQVNGNSKKRVKCVATKDKMNYEEVKGNQNSKRKRHIKKSFSRYIKDEERTFDIHKSMDFLKNWQFFLLLNVCVATLVSFLACGCFFALMLSQINGELLLEHNLTQNISQEYRENRISEYGSNDDKPISAMRKYQLMGKANKGHSASSKQNVLNRPVIFETIRESMELHYRNDRKEHDNPLASFVRTLVFERIIISYGSGMDPLTGKFTSPVDGVYMFYFSGTAISSTYLQVFTMKSIIGARNYPQRKKYQNIEDRFPKLHLAVELPTSIGCPVNTLSLNGSDTFKNEKKGNSCKSDKRAQVSHTFVKRLVKKEQLWLAVVLEHFYITTAMPMKLIGILQGP